MSEQKILSMSLPREIDKDGYLAVSVQVAGDDEPHSIRLRPSEVMPIIDDIIERAQHIDLPKGHALKHNLIKKRADIAELVAKAETDALLQRQRQGGGNDNGPDAA